MSFGVDGAKHLKLIQVSAPEASKRFLGAVCFEWSSSLNLNADAQMCARARAAGEAGDSTVHVRFWIWKALRRPKAEGQHNFLEVLIN